ncbi:hypothetical protein F5Y09DRAFT_326231 [Xylaria sp. FL1042]|nr:hypothetical protein F5Y09DRAFT_326231 [Xylaria sp. FL1042]
MSSSPGNQGGLYRTTAEVLPEPAFRAVIWFAVGVCTVASLIRYGIRLICWRRLLAEDYLMMLSFLNFLAIAVLLQVYVGDIYYFTQVERGLVIPGPDFERRILNALQSEGIILILGAVGIYTIKFNFLFFFYRLGHQIKLYRIVWAVAVSFVAACLAISLGIIPYDCTFGNVEQIIVRCSPRPAVAHIYTVYKLNVSLDVICDAIVVAFPVMITWRTKMTLRQKIVLSSVFLLVGFTIGVTIVRGSIFGGVYKDLDKANGKVFDSAWVSFWLYVEYFVSYFINCAISFRSLWINQKRKAQTEASVRNKQGHTNMARPADKGLKAKMQRLRQRVLGMLAHLEGTVPERERGDFIHHEPPSSDMTVDFSNWGTTQDSDVVVKPELRPSHLANIRLDRNHRGSFEQPRHIESNTVHQSTTSSALH